MSHLINGKLHIVFSSSRWWLEKFVFEFQAFAEFAERYREREIWVIKKHNRLCFKQVYSTKYPWSVRWFLFWEFCAHTQMTISKVMNTHFRTIFSPSVFVQHLFETLQSWVVGYDNGSGFLICWECASELLQRTDAAQKWESTKNSRAKNHKRNSRKKSNTHVQRCVSTNNDIRYLKTDANSSINCNYLTFFFRLILCSRCRCWCSCFWFYVLCICMCRYNLFFDTFIRAFYLKFFFVHWECRNMPG